MYLDLEQVMILLQRRYNTLREVGRLTDELQEAVSRDDHVSASLLLQHRAEELERYGGCQENILLMAEKGPEAAQAIRELVLSDSFAMNSPGRPEERKIRDIRQRTAALLGEIQEKDRNLNRRIGGDRSYYHKTDIRRH